MADSVLPRMIINLLNGKGVFVPTARAKVIRTIIPMIQQELPLLLEDHLFETINQAAHLRERIEFDLGDTPPADRCPRVHPRFAELVPASERRKWMTFLTLLEAKVDVVRGEAYILKDRPYSNSAYTNTAGFGGRRNLNVALIRTMDAGAQLGAEETDSAGQHRCNICEDTTIDSSFFDQGWWCDECDGRWCRDCVVAAFEVFLQGHGHAPLRCRCGDTIDLIEVHHVLPTKLLKDNANTIRALHAQEPLYCAENGCNRFLQDMAAPEHASAQDQAVSCAACGTATCRSCRELMRAHDELARCPAGNINEVRQRLTTGSLWKECRCGHVIEQNQGCIHMTCQDCLYEFCIKCNREWKTCDCRDN